MDKHDEKEHGWPGYYRCDDLVPPLCDDTMTVTNGTVETLGTGLVITYWRYTPAKLISSKFPIVVINGGPGLPHNYVKPTRNLACDGREVVMYDQAGTGWSQLFDQEEEDDEAPPELFTIEYYAEIELPALLQELGWDKYHILATSWGTQIAFQFAVASAAKNKKSGLQSLIMNAPIADNRRFIEYQWDAVEGSVGTMPTYVQERLQHFNDTQDFQNEEFQFLQNVVNANFNARLGVLVDCWTETEEAGISTVDLDQMMGVTDIFLPDVHASMRGWTVLPELHKLHDIPVQLNYGGFDMVRPQLVADTAAELGKGMVECHRLPRAAHALLLDAPGEVYPKIQTFLIRVEEAIASAGMQPFQATGSCPTVGKRTPTAPECLPLTNPLDSPTTRTLTLWLVAFVVSLAVAFKAGLWVGARQHR